MTDSIVWTTRADVVDALFLLQAKDPDRRFLRPLIQVLTPEHDVRLRMLWGEAEPEPMVGTLADLEAALTAALVERGPDNPARAAYFSWFIDRQEQDQPVAGFVIERVKGGCAVVVGRCRTFLPGSQSKGLTPKELVGQTLPVRILKVSVERANVVVSLVEVPSGEPWPGPSVPPPPSQDAALPKGLVDAVLLHPRGQALRMSLLRSVRPAVHSIWSRWFDLDHESARGFALVAPEEVLDVTAREQRLKARSRTLAAPALVDELRVALRDTMQSSMRQVAVRLCVDRPDAAGLLVDELQQVANTVPAVCAHGCCVGEDASVIALAALSLVPGPLASAAVARLIGRLGGSTAIGVLPVEAAAWLGRVAAADALGDAVLRWGPELQLAFGVGRGNADGLTTALNAALAGELNPAVFAALR